MRFAYRTLTVYGRPSQIVRLHTRFLTPRQAGGPSWALPQPRTRNPRRVSHAHGLGSSAFAHHYSRNHNLFSLPAGTEMFHFPAFPPTALYIQTAATPHDRCQVTPFGNPRITAWLPAPRGISQAPTSFIGSWCQGIHRMPLPTYQHQPLHKKGRKQVVGQSTDARVHYAVHKKQPDNHTHNPGQPQAKARGPEQSEKTNPQRGPFPQDPTVCPTHPSPRHRRFHTPNPTPRTGRSKAPTPQPRGAIRHRRMRVVLTGQQPRQVD